MNIPGRHLAVLVGMCGLLASCVGLVTNLAGLFITPVADEFGILTGASSLMLTICNVAFAIGGLLVPRLMREGRLNLMLAIGTVLLAGCTALLSICTDIFAMYLLCVIRGLAAGMMGFVFATTVLNQWFESGIGLATSIAMCCTGLTGAAFSPLVGDVVSGMGWRAGYLLLAALTVAFNLPAILFLPSLDPRVSGYLPLGASEGADAEAGPEHEAESEEDEPVREVVPLILMAVFLYSVFVSASTALPQHFPGIAKLYGHAATGATMLSFCMVVNSVGKIVYGTLCDRIGNRRSLLIYAAVVFTSLLMLLMLHSPRALVAAAAMYGLCYPLGTVSITMLTRDAFGRQNYGRTYPIIGMGGSIANAVFSSVVGYLYDFSGGYASPIVMMAVLMATAAVISVFVYARTAARTA